MKKECFQGLQILCATLLLVPLALASPQFFSNHITIPESGKVVVDISSLQESQVQSFLSSLERLKLGNEIKNFARINDKLFIDLHKKEGEVEITHEGIFIREYSDTYIIELREPPLLKKKKAIEDELDNLRKQIETQKKVERIGIASLEEQYQKKKQQKTQTLADHKNKLKTEHARAIADLSQRIQEAPATSLTGRVIASINRVLRITGNFIARITGFPVQEEPTPKPEREFSAAFNGIVIKASPKDIQKIKTSPYVKAIHSNQKVKALLLDSVPLIQADQAWSLGYTGRGITIAVIDTGIDYTHPDLGSCTSEQFIAGTCEKVIGGYDLINNDNDPMDDHGHGTHVAATAAGNGTVQTTIQEESPYEEVIVKSNFSSSDATRYGRIEFTRSDARERDLIFAYDLDTSPTGFTPVLAHRKLTSGRGYIHVVEGENARYYDSIILERGEYDATIVEIIDMVIDSSTSGYVTLENVFTYENFKVSLFNINGSYRRENAYFFGGGPYHIAVDSSGTFVNITWGNGSSPGFHGDKITIAPQIQLQNGSSMVLGLARHILQKYGNNCSAPTLDTPAVLMIGANNGKICTPLQERDGDIDVKEPALFGAEPVLCYWTDSNHHVCDDILGNLAIFINNSYFGDHYSLMKMVILPLNQGGSSGGGGGVRSAGIGATEQTIQAIKGVAPDAKLYGYKVLDSDGSGSFESVIAGIERAVDPNQDGNFSDHVDIISMSLGGPGDPDDPVSQAVDNAVDAGVIAVIAAGNSGPWPNSIGSPGTARKAITVGAFNKSGSIADFSSRGPVSWRNGTIIKPDVIAPGVGICAAQWDNWLSERKCLDDKHIAISGTSMATPHVSGLAAILKQKFSTLTPEEIKDLLKFTAKDLGYDINTQGAGRVDTIAALQAKIIVSGDLNFGLMQRGQTTATRKIKIKNMANEVLSINLFPQSAINEDQSTLDAISLNPDSLTLSPQTEEEIEVILNSPLTSEGFFTGKIRASDNFQNYSILYSFSRFSLLNLSVEGDHYPNFYLHDNQLNRFYGLSQGGDFEIGNTASLFVKSGSYTVYAINDFINPENPLGYPETDEYILIDIIDIPADAEVSKAFSLSNARPFLVKAQSLSGKQLRLTEWQKGVATYKKKFDSCGQYGGTNETYCKENPEGFFCSWSSKYSTCTSRSFSANFFDPLKGDRIIYLNNKPDNGLDIDITLKYIGVPDE